MIIAQFVKAVCVKRDYEIEVEFNVAFDEFQQIYLEPEKREQDEGRDNDPCPCRKSRAGGLTACPGIGDLCRYFFCVSEMPASNIR